MIRRTVFITSTLFLLTFSSAAEPLAKKMTAVKADFAALQPYLANSDEFMSKSKEREIHRLILSFEDHIHAVQESHAGTSSEPGFKDNIKVLSDLLHDASIRFQEGRKSYALWRLRTVSQNCTTCHSQYNMSLNAPVSEKITKALNHFELGEYFLATRQFDKAKTEFIAAARDATLSDRRMSALRKLLVIETRRSSSPNDAVDLLEPFRNDAGLPQVDRGEIEGWLASLESWKNEKRPREDSVSTAEALFRSAFHPDTLIPRVVDSVAMLRATSILHRVLARPSLPKPERARALYLLGYGYTLLPLYFIDELPEIYLALCIEEFQGTKEAQDAYIMLKDKTEVDFSGSQGTNIPGDVAARLNELHDKAYGIPAIKNRI